MVMEKYRGSSSGDGEQAEQAEQVRIDIPDRLLHQLKSLDDARMSEEPDQQQPTRPLIQEVPSALSDKKMRFKRYYEPMIVCIGPIQSVKNLDSIERWKRLYKGVYNGEVMKLRLARQFIQENGIPRETALIKILGEHQALIHCYERNCRDRRILPYLKESNRYSSFSEKWCNEMAVLQEFSNSDLPFMFLVDGCALLHFMVNIVGDNEDLLLQHVNYDFISFAKRDIFLLENQLPYRLLQLLISSIPKENTGLFNRVRGSEDEEFVIRKFTFIMSPGMGRLQKEQQPQPQPLHLLDLLHRNLTFVPRRQMDLTGCWGRSFMTCNYIFNRLSIFHNRLKHYTYYAHYGQATFCCATELKSAGIGFNQSPTDSVTDVTFQQKILSGTLSLPSFTVNDSTISMFLNLIAYEMCPDFKSKFEVTSYICFLDALINHPDDVWLLRQAGLLRNQLGSDEDVAKLVKQMAIGLVPNPEMYRRTKSEMYKQHKNTGIIRYWLAEMKEKYFSNPWTFLAICGAVFGLVLSFIQAWFAVKSYYHPQKA